MSGLEVAGVLLGTFPLIISGLEHWRAVAKVGGFYRRLGKEYRKCRSDVEYYEILYKGNLKELLLPIVGDVDDVNRLIRDPGGNEWASKTLEDCLQRRLQESYTVYMEIIQEMNEIAEDLKKELNFDKANLQAQLGPPQGRSSSRPQTPQPSSKHSKLASVKSKVDYEAFRVKFSLGEPVRDGLFQRLKESNERLEKLLKTSDKISILQDAASPPPKKTSGLETAYRKVWRQSDLLFKAIQNAWQCSCRPYHFAGLKLEHRTMTEICFEVILMFVAPSTHGHTPWSWRELQCGHLDNCTHAKNSQTLFMITSPLSLHPTNRIKQTSTLPQRKTVAFAPPAPVTPAITFDLCDSSTVDLCDRLASIRDEPCMGIIGHDEETYHLHPFPTRREPRDEGPLTLSQLLSPDFEGHVSRRQRYSIALLVASSVAQLRSTPWLKSSLTKEDILFFPIENCSRGDAYGEPFIRQGFSNQPYASNGDPEDYNFLSLGILLLELCFGRRLEDHPLRKKHPIGEGETKQAFDVMAALIWSQRVDGEAGDGYASAVRWCFTGASVQNQSWRGEIIKNVIRPLEMCQEHFKTADSI